MLCTNAFNYVNVLDRAADASWKRESLISNNLANVDTPGFKRQDLDFQTALKTELARGNHDSLDERIDRLDYSKLNPMSYTDLAGYSYRLDGSNVDVDTENVELASEQLRYQGIAAGINQEFSRMRAVIK